MGASRGSDFQTPDTSPLPDPSLGGGRGSLGLEADLAAVTLEVPGLGLGHPRERGKQGPRRRLLLNRAMGAGVSAPPESSPPFDVCVCSVCGLDGDLAKPVCDHVSAG